MPHLPTLHDLGTIRSLFTISRKEENQGMYEEYNLK